MPGMALRIEAHPLCTLQETQPQHRLGHRFHVRTAVLVAFDADEAAGTHKQVRHRIGRNER
jgi:hypothetical protein